jgi:hypothetical protein
MESMNRGAVGCILAKLMPSTTMHVTPSFKSKTECIDHVRQDQVTHMQRHCEYQNQCHTNKELLHDQSLKQNIINEFSQRIKCLHRQLTEDTHT